MGDKTKSDDDTYAEEECLELEMCLFESLGHFLSQDKITTRIACEKDNVGGYRQILLIPTGWIVSMVQLSPVTGV